VTGWEVSLPELLALGARRVNRMRAFNAREGLTREQDTLPKKMFTPLQGEQSVGVSVDRAVFEQALETCYTMAGWDVRTGIPTRDKLQALG